MYIWYICSQFTIWISIAVYMMYGMFDLEIYSYIQYLSISMYIYIYTYIYTYIYIYIYIYI